MKIFDKLCEKIVVYRSQSGSLYIRDKVSLRCSCHKVIHSFSMNIYTHEDHPRQQPSITIPLLHVNNWIQMSLFFLINQSNLLKRGGRGRLAPRSQTETFTKVLPVLVKMINIILQGDMKCKLMLLLCIVSCTGNCK